MKHSFKKALEIIEKDYKTPSHLHENCRDCPDEDYLELFAIIQREWNRKKRLPDSEELRKFAYAGCLNFSRWYLPSPYILSDRSYDHFAKCLTLLKRTGSHPDNVAPLELQKIKSEIFNEFHLRNLIGSEKEITERLDELEKKTISIRSPSHHKKSLEVTKSKEELVALIKSIRDQTINSIITTTLPFPAASLNAKIEFTWKEMPIRVELYPSFQAPGNSLFDVSAEKGQEAFVVNSMPSKWQYGQTKITICLPCLADHCSICPPLTWLPQQPNNNHGWPSTYFIAFDIIERVNWHLGTYEQGFSQYLLNPSDLSCIEHSLFAGERKIFSLKKDHPGAVFNVTFRDKDNVDEIYINEEHLSYPAYSQRCKRMAENYLASGESNNSIIWLNIALEALVKERITIFSGQCGQPSLEKEVYEDIDRFGEAREIVEKQYPGFARQVRWPKSTYSPSISKVIKRLSELVELQIDLNMLSAQYRNIQKNRGAAVHGEELGVVSAEAVREALESYDWIDSQFILKE